MTTQAQTKLKVLLVADSCVDEYVFGSCYRMSREAPIPIFKPTRTENRPGMGRNVEWNLEAFDIDVRMFTHEPPVRNVRYVDERYNVQVFRTEHDRDQKEGSLVQLQRELSFDPDVVVISDYGTGFITYELIDYIQLHYSGPIYIDTKKTDLARFDRCFIKINEEEYKARTSDGRSMIVSMGGDGAMYDNKMYPVPKVEVSDVCGAGDTFLAAMVYAHQTTGNIEAAIDYANKAAAISVQHLGCYAMTLDDLESIENGGDWRSFVQ